MDLATQILTNIIENHKKTKITISISKDEIKKLYFDICYKALSEIHSLIKDETLSDFICMEKIVQIFERLGSDGGFRHDIG